MLYIFTAAVENQIAAGAELTDKFAEYYRIVVLNLIV